MLDNEFWNWKLNEFFNMFGNTFNRDVWLCNHTESLDVIISFPEFKSLEKILIIPNSHLWITYFFPPIKVAFSPKSLQFEISKWNQNRKKIQFKFFDFMGNKEPKTILLCVNNLFSKKIKLSKQLYGNAFDQVV